MVTYDKDYENIILCLDTKCPYVLEKGAAFWGTPLKEVSPETKGCPNLLTNLPHNFVMPYQPDTIKIATIKNLGGFRALALEHKPLFDKYLKNQKYSTRAFVNIYIWSDLFNILWKIIDNNLCIFYKYKNEFNMLLPPIANPSLRGAKRRSNLLAKIGDCFAPLPANGIQCTGCGARNDVRIENIAKEEIEALKRHGVKIHKNTDEYIYLAKDIAELKGNKFSKQRAAANHFVKNNKFTYRPFEIDDIDNCIALYGAWAQNKNGDCPVPATIQSSGLSPFLQDSVSAQLIADSFSAQRKAMLNYEELKLVGRVVEIGGKIHAYTFAFKMNADTYCVVFETADTNIKGLSQFIFSRFAQELRSLNAEYINAMDDSGLANLKKTKLSWRPHKILTNYIGVI